MYLTYTYYTEMGGTLDSSAFSIAERKARYLINAQAGGMTGERIKALAELPEAVKDCTFDLVGVISANTSSEKQISSESQSQGGKSESYSYEIKSDEDIAKECRKIIEDYFYGGGIGDLLYRGV